MKQYQTVLLQLVCILFLHDNASAQASNGLKQLDGTTSKVLYSAGYEQRAKDIALQFISALDYHQMLLNFKPDVTLLVLSTEDWIKHTDFPVYGMPHYTGKKTLVVATSDNAFWKSFIPLTDKLPAPIAEKVTEAYGKSDGTISMQPFFDLLAIHELGHAFHIQGGLKMQRKWMGELFCNLLLHTFVAEKAPDQLIALTTFPQMLVAGGTMGLDYTSLKQFEDNYELIGKSHPKNYGWYQSKLHVGAQHIYDAGGKEVLQKLWSGLMSKDDVKEDKDFTDFLRAKVHKSVAEVVFKW